MGHKAACFPVLMMDFSNLALLKGDGPRSAMTLVNSLTTLANLLLSEVAIHSSLNRLGDKPMNPINSFITPTLFAVM